MYGFKKFQSVLMASLYRELIRVAFSIRLQLPWLSQTLWKVRMGVKLAWGPELDLAWGNRVATTVAMAAAVMAAMVVAFVANSYGLVGYLLWRKGANSSRPQGVCTQVGCLL